MFRGLGPVRVSCSWEGGLGAGHSTEGDLEVMGQECDQQRVRAGTMGSVNDGEVGQQRMNAGDSII